MTNQKKAPLLPCIQLLRFFAALGVMLSHVGFGDSYITNISFSTGVNLFYCISAFLMMYTTQKSTPKHFISKRLIRLIPLYWILTILTFFAAMLIPSLSDGSNSISELIKSLFFIPYVRDGLKTAAVIRPIVGPAWTLTYDIFFLFLFALSMKISHKWRGVLSSIGCLTLLFVGKMLPDQIAIGRVLARDFWLNYIFGIAVFYIWKFMQDKEDLKKKALPIWTIIGIASFAWLFIGYKPLILCAVLSFASLTCILLAMGEKSVPKFFVTFGAISYSFYLTHYYVILIIGMFINFEELSIATCVGTVIAFFLSLAVGYISYILIEKKLGDFLKSKLLPN